jgi:deazaflavin-dependent oxidoreductase (nitroreductase family)
MALNRGVVKVFSTMHRFWYGATGGRVGGRMNGMDVLLLTTRGRKSGKTRTTPLQYMADGETLVVVASNGGSPRHPGWWLNIKGDPNVTVNVKGERRSMRAEAASPEDKARLWPRLVELYDGYAGYQKETSREIPVVILRADGAR